VTNAERAARLVEELGRDGSAEWLHSSNAEFCIKSTLDAACAEAVREERGAIEKAVGAVALNYEDGFPRAGISVVEDILTAIRARGEG
jgi:hypothetical protein